MDKLIIFLINANVDFFNLNLLADNEFKKFVAKHCDNCGKLFADKYPTGLCCVVSKEVLFLESLADTLLSLSEDVSKGELTSSGIDLVNKVKLFLFTRPFNSVLNCDVERQLVLSKLTKISSQINKVLGKSPVGI